MDTTEHGLGVPMGRLWLRSIEASRGVERVASTCVRVANFRAGCLVPCSLIDIRRSSMSRKNYTGIPLVATGGDRAGGT